MPVLWCRFRACWVVKLLRLQQIHPKEVGVWGIIGLDFCRASEQNCEQRFGPISRQLLSRYSAMFELNYLKFQTNHIAEAGLPTTIGHNYFQLGPLYVPAWELLCTSRSKFCQQRNYLEVLALILVGLSLKFGSRSYRALPTYEWTHEF